MEKSEGEILNIEGGGPSWPDRLTNIDCAPEELWLRGENRLVSKSRAIAIVGSRSPTPYGLEQARLFAGTFAAAGVVVISGLARGVDAAAHTAALDAGGETIAVLGTLYSNASSPITAPSPTESTCAPPTEMENSPPSTR